MLYNNKGKPEKRPTVKKEKVMKKRYSVFWSTTIIILPVVILAAAVVLVISYNYVYNLTYHHSVHDIRQAAELTDEILEDTDLIDEKVSAVYSDTLDKLCELLEIPYIYVVEINEAENTLKYLAIGIGEGASKEFIDSRDIGYVVKENINEHQIAALNGRDDNNVEHIVNNFGDTMVYYLKRTGDSYKNQLVCAEINITDYTQKIQRDFNFMAFATLLFVLFVVLLFATVFHFKVSKPAKAISRKMSGFVREHEKHFEPLRFKGSREFSEMTEAFNTMAEDIDRYLKSISELNRQKAELSIARDIQIGLLEPADFENEAVVIKAYMLPAKDVGGDLYDYQTLSDGRLCVVIADVSGKGVSAALFMSRAVTLINQYAEEGLSPGKILFEYNNHLAARNPNMMFITTFVGILDPKTGFLVYSNAGHNDPYIISDKLIKLDGEHGVAAGVFNDIGYPEHTVKMDPGDLLFLFTDGVTEAKNSREEMFGDDALEQELRNLKNADNDEVISHVLKKLKEFTGDAEQADDITMLTLRVNSRFNKELHLEAKTET